MDRDDIADQANLLSLNAAIEAARCGEAGHDVVSAREELISSIDTLNEKAKSLV